MLEPRGSFASVVAKLDRGREHANCLRDEIQRWVDGKPTPLALGVDPQGEAFVHRFYVRFIVKPDIARWGLLFGDAVHNLRSALDHLIYALAVQATDIDPPTAEGTLQMPIIDDGKHWKGHKDDRLTGLDDLMRAFVEAVQPYKVTPEGPRSDRLWIIREFDNADKHRAIRPVGVIPHEFEIPLLMRGGTAMPTIIWHNVALDEDEATLANVVGTAPTRVEGYSKAKMSIGVEYGRDGAEAIEINSVLDEMIERVAGIVGEAESRWFT